MTVRSQPAPSSEPTQALPPAAYRGGRRTDISMVIAKIGVGLAVIAFGGVIWAINGGFSVIGLSVVAAAFNSAGQLFWAAVSSITFDVPVAVPGLPTAQPLIPWCGVVAASLLQIVVIWRKLSGRPIPRWLFAVAAALSIYDYATTFFGLGSVVWLQQVGWFVQAIITAFLTFSIEAAVGFVLRR